MITILGSTITCKCYPLPPTYVNGDNPILDVYSAIKDLSPCVFLRHAIKVIGKWMDKISSSPGFPANYPLHIIKAAMATIMRNNHFAFGDLNILQLLGTAMGTSIVNGVYEEDGVKN